MCRPRARISDCTTVFPCYIPDVDTSIVTCCRDLVCHFSETERVDSSLVVIAMLFSRRPHRVDIQLVLIITCSHDFAASRKCDLSDTRSQVILVLLGDGAISVPELDHLVLMTSCNHGTIWR